MGKAGMDEDTEAKPAGKAGRGRGVISPLWLACMSTQLLLQTDNEE